MTGFSFRFLAAATFATAIALAPAVQARDWHHGGGYRGGWHGPQRHGNAAGAAIIGGLIGLGVGAAIASGGRSAPPPAYYGAPGYYAPPPAVYYGY